MKFYLYLKIHFFVIWYADAFTDVQILFLERNFYVKCNMNFILYFKKAILSINITENEAMELLYYIWNQYCTGSSNYI